MKRYRKIIAYPKPKAIEALVNYNFVTITEKIDGANASVKLDVGVQLDPTGKIKCFSRNNELSGEDDLRGFRQWVIDNVSPHTLYPGITYFGEWLVPHKVKYLADAYNKFYLFDLYSETDNKYYPCTNEVGIQFVEETKDALFAPVLYVGKMPSIRNILGEIDIIALKVYMKQSVLGAEVPEGIVIKDYQYINTWGEHIVVKLINTEFREVQVNNQQRKPKVYSQQEQLVMDTLANVINKISVEKHMMKLVDEGIINIGWKDNTLSNLIPLSVKSFRDDVLEEHFDITDLDKSELKFISKSLQGMFVHKLKELYLS